MDCAPCSGASAAQLYEAGSLLIPVGQQDITIGFDTIKESRDLDISLNIENLVDDVPQDIALRLIARERTGFRVWIIGAPLTPHNTLRWQAQVRLTGGCLPNCYELATNDNYLAIDLDGDPLVDIDGESLLVSAS